MNILTGNKLTYLQTLAIPFRIAPVLTSLLLLNSLINLAAAPVSLLVTAFFLDSALDIVTNNKDINLIILPLVAIGAFATYRYILTPLSKLIGTKISIKAKQTLRVPLLEKRSRVSYKHIENSKTQDLINRVWDNPEGRLTGALTNFVQLFVMLGSVSSYIIILMVNAPLAGTILLVLSIPIFIMAIKSGKYSYEARREFSLEQRLAWYISYAIWGRDAASERNMFGTTDFLNDKYYHFNEINRKNVLKVETKWFIRSRASASLLVILSAAGLFTMLPAVVAGNLTVGLFIMLQTALFTSASWLAWGLPSSFTQIAHEKEFIKDLNDFWQLCETDNAETMPDTQPFLFESLEFKDVTFSYPGTEKVILDRLSMKIEKDKHYSLVGVNGAGKTTLTKLITRLYDDYTGEILLNGRPLREWPIQQIKSCFCALFQDFARFDITVAENAAVGKIHGATEEEIDRALQLAGFDTNAKELKNGKNTLLGKTHEGGVDLSGGQWQRLAFARAILSCAPVKILDEPTAALDPVAESQVYAQFESISRNSTTIFISHRLASAKMADVIFVIEDGRVKEQGSHQQLMEKQGAYAQMFKSQQSWYL